MRKTFVMLGLPASGKGTQSDILAKKVDATIIGVGNLVRAEIEKGDKNSDRFKRIKENYDKGVPQEDELTENLVDEAVSKIEGNLIFDNYPFSENQINFFLSILKKYDLTDPIVICIKINPDSAIKRISTRLICDKCKAIYLEGKEGDQCKKCDGKLFRRKDDTSEIMRERIQFAEPRINTVINYFEPFGNVHIIDGEKPIEEVAEEIDKIIK